jgi:serine/threonine-protein kinase
VLATYSSLVGLDVGGKYEVRRVLGAGGMGVVCEAVHRDLGKRVAVKLIDKSMKESELIVTRFRREARAAGQIASEHIVDVFDVGADARVGLYMVMEYLVGEDLQSRLEREGRIDVKSGVMIAHQVARALAKAHDAGVIHRDLKPGNVFLTQRDNGQMLVKLLDFGVSKLLNEGAGSARITGVGTPIGTPLYMSPEQAEGKDDVDGRVDIWSLGAVLYEALAGALPFADRGGYHATIIGILTSRPRPLHDVAPWVPAPLAEVVDAMLVHDREARISDAAAVTRRLLDVFPTVLPDGTGKHTAVIVTQSATAIDATGDTEFFTGSPLPPAGSSHSGRIPAVASSSSPLPLTDSSRTLGQPVDLARTAKMAPIELGARVPGVDGTPRSSPNTAPLIGAVSSPVASSPRGASLPDAARDDAPPTVRDDALARRGGARRRLTFALTVLLLVGVAVASFFAGRRLQSGAAP